MDEFRLSASTSRQAQVTVDPKSKTPRQICRGVSQAEKHQKVRLLFIRRMFPKQGEGLEGL